MNAEYVRKLLLVEDNPGDARLIAEILNRIGDIEMVTASTLSEALEYLREQQWDVILMDLGLPDSEGIETLEKVRTISPKACVVVLTGIESEEIGTQSIRQGADDYLVKGYVDERALSASLRYAVERKNAREVLEESERNMAKAQSIAHVGSWEWDMSRDALYWSDELYRIFGLIPQESASTYEAFINTIHPNDRKYAEQKIREVFSSKKSYFSTHRIVRPDGSERVVEEQGEPSVAADGTIAKIVGTVQDITDRTQTEQALEESEEKYRGITERSFDMIFTLDVDGFLTYVSPVVEKELCYRPEEILGKHFSELLVDKESPEVMNSLEQTIKGIQGETIELDLFRKDGTIANTELSPSSIVKEGQVIGAQGIFRNITDRKRAEEALILRLQMEETISAVSTRFVGGRNIDESINDSLADVGRLSGASRAYLFLLRNGGDIMDNTHEWCEDGVAPERDNLLGLPTETFSWRMAKLREGETIHITDVSEMPPEAIAEREHIKNQGIRSLIIIPVNTGSELAGFIGLDSVTVAGSWTEENIMLLRIVSEVVGVALSRKRAEDETLRRAEYEELIATLSTDFISLPLEEIDATTNEALAAIGEFIGADRSYLSLVDDEGTVMSITHEWCASGIEPQIQDLQNVSIEPLEWSMEALKSLRVLSIDDVSDLPPEAAVEKELFKSQGIVSAILVPMAYKTTFMGFIGFDSVGTRRIWSDEDTMLLKMAGSIFVNALIRKKAELSIRESEEKLRSVMETVPGVVVTLDRDCVIQYINRTIPEMTAKEAIGTRIMDHIRPEFHDTAIRSFNTVFETEQGAEYQSQGLGPDGETVWYSTRIEPIKGPDGVTGATAISFDITDQKRMTEALRESEDKFRTIFENVNDEILYLDMNGKIIDVNGRGETIFGWKREEVVGRQFSEFDFVDPALMSGFTDSFMRAAQGENTGLVSIKAKRKDGTRVFIEASISLIEHEDVPQNLLITVRDVSDRMRVEEALKESEANWRSLTENSPDQIMTLDADARIIFANRLVSNWTKKPAVGTSFYDHTSEEYKPVVRKCFDEVLKTGKTSEFESVFRDDKGKLHYLEYYVGPVMRPGRVTGLTVRSTDITHRKQSEKALLQANAGLNYLNSLARTLAQCTTPKDVFERALDQTLDSLGLPIGAIYLLDEDENVLTLVTYSGMDESLARASRNINIKPNGTKITSRKASIDTQIADRARAVLQSIGLPFCMISPLQSHNRTLGLVCVASQEERDFSEEDARLLETVGAEIGISMERARLLDELKELSRTDDLTGLDNRRRFYEVLEAEISRVTRYGGSSSLVMIDLDGFKEYNDKLGHTNGDAILRSFARMLRSALRKSDIAFRYGGDEFVIVLPSTPSDKVHRVIKRIQSRWAQIMDKHVPDGGIKLDFSAGTVQLPEDAETPDALIFLADTALYYSKRMGGARLTVASDLGPSEADTFGTATPDQVYALASTVDAKDKYTFGHSARVASIAGILGKAIGLSQKELADLHSASILHDIGKIGVPDSVLCKPGKLTDEEWLLIKRHSSEGSKIVGHIKELRSIVPYILHHHEWYDGNGYPDGLAGKDIPLAARIISIADAYDTMTTDRTYRRAMSSELAIAELQRCKGTQFDPHLVKEFCRTFDTIEDRITDDGMQTIPE